MARDADLRSGFVNHDYILTFSSADPAARARFLALCQDVWQGAQVTPETWEISNDLTPDAMESLLLDLLGDGDRAAYYYLSASKRIFRVVLG